MIDVNLFEKAASGDKESFKTLIEPVKDSLYKVAFVYLKNEDDALDCVHDAIIKAIKSLKKLKEPQYFNTWITRITINVCKDYLKKKSKMVIVDINECEGDFVTDGFEIEEQEEIKSILNKLSDKERDVIVKRYLEDKSLKDISTSMKLPVGTVKSRISRSLKKLRVYMGEV